MVLEYDDALKESSFFEPSSNESSIDNCTIINDYLISRDNDKVNIYKKGNENDFYSFKTKKYEYINDKLVVDNSVNIDLSFEELGIFKTIDFTENITAPTSIDNPVYFKEVSVDDYNDDEE